MPKTPIPISKKSRSAEQGEQQFTATYKDTVESPFQRQVRDGRPNSNSCLFDAATGDNHELSDLATDLEHDHTYIIPLAHSGCIVCSGMDNLRPLVVLKERAGKEIDWDKTTYLCFYFHIALEEAEHDEICKKHFMEWYNIFNKNKDKLKSPDHEKVQEHNPNIKVHAIQ